MVLDRLPQSLSSLPWRFHYSVDGDTFFLRVTARLQHAYMTLDGSMVGLEWISTGIGREEGVGNPRDDLCICFASLYMLPLYWLLVLCLASMALGRVGKTHQHGAGVWESGFMLAAVLQGARLGPGLGEDNCTCWLDRVVHDVCKEEVYNGTRYPTVSTDL
jgi:hypothetical protein